MAAARAFKIAERFAEEFASIREKVERMICEGLVLTEFPFDKASHLITVSNKVFSPMFLKSNNSPCPLFFFSSPFYAVDLTVPQ